MNASPLPLDKFVLTIQELSLARDLDTVMKIVRDGAREITGADGATFILKENDQCFYADENAIGPLWKGNRFPMNSCVSGWAMKHRKAVIIEDIFRDERIPIDLYQPTFVKSMAMVPIRTIDPIGAIGNYWATKHTPTAQEVTILQSLADFTAIALENVNIYSELERRVKARTAELEEANKGLEAFSYSVSHDLRAPLRTIHAYIGILKEECEGILDDKNKQIAGKIQRKVEEMQRLIDNLLSFFSLGSKEVNKTLVNMNELVSAVCHGIQEQEAARSLDFQIDELPSVDADPGLIRQVWYNLIGNAAKFTRLTAHPNIRIGYEKQDGEVVFFVRDNGSGFDMAHYEKLFGVFNRLHAQREFDGNGIGLAIVQKIVSKHGGRVWATSAKDQGAAFYFTLSS